MVTVILIAGADEAARDVYVQHSVNADFGAQGCIAQWNIAHERFISGEPVNILTLAELQAFIANNPYWELKVTD